MTASQLISVIRPLSSSYELLNAEEALGQLVRSELIFRRGEVPHAVYTFKHTLVRDAAYSGL